MAPRKLLIRNTQSPGDIVVLTAAIRDLHKQYPGRFETSIEVSQGAETIFYGSPYIKPRNKFQKKDIFVAKYPLIHKSNQARKHFIWGFIEYFNKQLKLDIKLSDFRPDIHISEKEAAVPLVQGPYWVFLSGGKKDFTTKLWARSYWQEVIDGTQDRVRWVQAGTPGHLRHNAMNNIHCDMIGKTNFREFIRLIYHAEGVVCYMTAAMHIAAAFNKPCVVIGGGREPWWWEAYNTENRVAQMRFGQPDWVPPQHDDFVPHQFLHTIGKLGCCRTAGCWKKWIEKKRKGSVCTMPDHVGGERIPKCKAMITPQMVMTAIDWYYDEGYIRGNRPASVHPDSVKLAYCVFIDGAATPEIAGWVQQVLEGAGSNVIVAHSGSADSAVEAIALRGGASYRQVESRPQALRMAAEAGSHVVWMEHGATPTHKGWAAELKSTLAGYPQLHGRIHRTFEGGLYPYPNFFATPVELLSLDKDRFVDIFSGLKSRDVRPAAGLVTLPTRPIQLAGV